MNGWELLAETLGLDLEEEFIITDVNGERIDENVYRITEKNGIQYKKPMIPNWDFQASYLVVNLLSDSYKAVPLN